MCEISANADVCRLYEANGRIIDLTAERFLPAVDVMTCLSCIYVSNLMKLDLVHYRILLQMLHQLAIHLLATALLYCIALESW